MDMKEIIQYAGGAKQIAEACEVSHQTVYQWKKVPPKYCITIEKKCGGRVKREEMRPDVYCENGECNEKTNT